MAAFPRLDGMNDDPHHASFTLQWTNNATHTEPMTSKRIGMRTWTWPWGLTCKRLYLDQVFIVFRPTAEIQSTEFVPGDSATQNWKAETMQLYVRSDPGHEHPVFAEGQGYRPLTYSCALAITPDVEGSEDYWCRTYRPLRDVPIATGLNGCTEFSMELLFPTLFVDPTPQSLEQIPSYRILKVICHFSAEL